MRSLAYAVLAMTCAIGLGAPALAAETMSAHQAPALMPAGSADKDGDDGHHRHGHHRRGLVLPFVFFGPAAAPQVIVAQPDASSPDPAPPPPASQSADQPPCRETSAEGVVILRGTGCTPDNH